MDASYIRSLPENGIETGTDKGRWSARPGTPGKAFGRRQRTERGQGAGKVWKREEKKVKEPGVRALLGILGHEGRGRG